MIQIDPTLAPADLLPAIETMWQHSARKIDAIERSRRPGDPSPVFTRAGRYTAQAWTEWTQGFQYGSALLQFDATGEDRFLKLGRAKTLEVMHGHVSHAGVHDHGFNNLSTYGNLLRLGVEGRCDMSEAEKQTHTLALQVSGAVQAGRWTPTADGGGFIHSFNGPQSLFVDTVRSCRILAVSHLLGHHPLGEQDAPLDLPGRMVKHLKKTADFNVFYGKGRDFYDTPAVRGRTAHESLWNPRSGVHRCASTQQGYSAFSTWTRGLSWAMCGFAEQLELLRVWPELYASNPSAEQWIREAAEATCDFFIQHTPTDGVPYWDTGAPGLVHLGDYLNRAAEPFNAHEPVDSSAAAIGCQGLIRLGRYLGGEKGARYERAGYTVLRTLLAEPYVSTDAKHEGLLLHSVYHRPNGWDHVPAGRSVPCGESSMWGDYHLREAALLVQRIAKGEPYYTFFGCCEGLA